MKIIDYVAFDSKKEREDFIQVMETIDSNASLSSITKAMEVAKIFNCQTHEAVTYLNVYLTKFKKK